MKNPSAQFFTALTVISLIFSADLILRSVEDQVSPNIAHINQISNIAMRYREDDDHSLLFIGNSLINNGVNVDIFQTAMRQRGIDFSYMEKIVPDSTTMWAWSCILENQFFDQMATPSTVIIGFAWNQLSDQSRRSPTALGAFFCSAADVLKLNATEQMTSAELGEYLTASILRIYAHRETIRNRILNTLLPHYQSTTQEMNRRLRENTESSTQHSLSYELLRKIDRQMAFTHSHLVLVAMPVRDKAYDLDDALLDLSMSDSITLLDYRRLSGISPEHFLDDMHLSEKGATILTTALVNDLYQINNNPK